MGGDRSTSPLAAGPPRPAAAPLWARIVPLRALSDARFVPLALGLAFALLAARSALEPVSDQDVWWIAAAGRELLASGDVPRTNGWAIASEDAALPWVMHEWALGPLFAWGLEGLGARFVILLGLVGAAATLGLSIAWTMRARHLASAAIALLGVATFVRETLFSPRPAHLLLALPLGLAWLALDPRWSRGRAVGCVALVWAWSFVHGSFALGLGMLALALLAADRTQRASRGSTLLVALGATLIGPYGPALHGLVARYLLGADPAARVIHEQIAEFSPLWRAEAPWGSPLAWTAALVAAWLGLLALVRGGDRMERGRGVLALGLALMGTMTARHVPLAALVALTLCVPRIDAALDHAALAPTEPRRSMWPTLLASLAGLAVGGATAWVGPVQLDPQLGGGALAPLAAGLGERGAPTYVPFDAAGHVVWIEPGIRVLHDPRNDCYSERTARFSVALEQGRVDPSTLARELAARGVDALLIPADHPVALALGVASAPYRRVATEGEWQRWER